MQNITAHGLSGMVGLGLRRHSALPDRHLGPALLRSPSVRSGPRAARGVPLSSCIKPQRRHRLLASALVASGPARKPFLVCIPQLMKAADATNKVRDRFIKLPSRITLVLLRASHEPRGGCRKSSQRLAVFGRRPEC